MEKTEKKELLPLLKNLIEEGQEVWKVKIMEKNYLQNVKS